MIGKTQDEVMGLYEKTKAFRNAMPSSYDFVVPDALQPHIYEWHKQFKRNYIEVLKRIENLPDDPSFEKTKQLLDSMNKFFLHLANLAKSEYHPSNRDMSEKDRATMSDMFNQALTQFMQDPAIKKIEKVGVDCEKIFRAELADRYVKKYSNNNTQPLESSTKKQKDKLMHQYNKSQNKSERYAGAAEFCAFCSLCFLGVTLPILPILFIKKHRAKKKSQAIMKQLMTLDPTLTEQWGRLKAQTPERFTSDAPLEQKNAQQMSELKQTLRETVQSVKADLQGEIDRTTKPKTKR